MYKNKQKALMYEDKLSKQIHYPMHQKRWYIIIYIRQSRHYCVELEVINYPP